MQLFHALFGCGEFDGIPPGCTGAFAVTRKVVNEDALRRVHSGKFCGVLVDTALRFAVSNLEGQHNIVEKVGFVEHGAPVVIPGGHHI